MKKKIVNKLTPTHDFDAHRKSIERCQGILSDKLQQMGARDICVLATPGFGLFDFVLVTDMVDGISKKQRDTFCQNLPKSLKLPKKVTISSIVTRQELVTMTALY